MGTVADARRPRWRRARRVAGELSAITGAFIVVAMLASAMATASPTPGFKIVGIAQGQTVSGAITLETVPVDTSVHVVDYFIDGVLKNREWVKPYCLTSDGGPCKPYDTTALPDGSHTFTVVLRPTSTTSLPPQGVTVTVANHAPTLPAPGFMLVGLAQGQTVSGAITLETVPVDTSVFVVDYYIDGVLMNREWVTPYCLTSDGGPCKPYDTTALPDGSHTFSVVLRPTSTTSLPPQSVTVTVANHAPTLPAPGTAPPDPGTAPPDPGTAPPDPGTAPPAPGTGNSVETIISDQQGTHEGVIPLPDGYSWKPGPEIQSGNNNQGMAAAVTWGALFLDGQPVDANLNPGTGNTRVQVRNMKLWMLSKSTGDWVLVVNAQDHGMSYREDFVGDVSWGMDVRDESEGMSGKLNFVGGQRGAWHFWTPRAMIDPNDVGGVVGTFQGRLVLDNPSGPDDRAFWSTRLLLGAGVDYWRDLSASWPNNAGASVGKFKFVTPSWRAYNTTTLTPEQLRANPPPLD